MMSKKVNAFKYYLACIKIFRNDENRWMKESYKPRVLFIEFHQQCSTRITSSILILAELMFHAKEKSCVLYFLIFHMVHTDQQLLSTKLCCHGLWVYKKIMRL